MKCSGKCRYDEADACGGCGELERIVDRLGRYEDTGLKPEEIAGRKMGHMKMTADEAIRRIEDHIRVHGIGERPHVRIAEALYMAIDALEEYKGTEKPRPLTQEELREMDGQEVFCRELNTKVKVFADWTGFIFVGYRTPRDTGAMRAMGLTLYPADAEERDGS